jgi:predicted AAA+ superfamily ATPase
VQTFLERDVPQLGITIPPPALLRFWTMLAHYHGQIWNAADPARSLGVSEPTVRRYLDLLTGLFMVRQLPPWHENLKKRQVRAPKIYLRDSGLMHALLGIGTEQGLLAHPKSGASWEGYAIEQALKLASPSDAYFWATHQGAELDLLLMKNGKRIGIEAKRADAPTLTPSMRIAIEDLRLDQLTVLYPGERQYTLSEKVTVVPVTALATLSANVLWPRRHRD